MNENSLEKFGENDVPSFLTIGVYIAEEIDKVYMQYNGMQIQEMNSIYNNCC